MQASLRRRWLLIRLIGRSIWRRVEDLNAHARDFMATVAAQDYLNYLKYRSGVLGLLVPEERVLEKFLGSEEELVRNLETWLDLWEIKWRSRVKLVMKETSEFRHAATMESDVAPVWNRFGRRDELRELVVGSLIAAGEICFTDLVAENLIKAEIQKYVRQVSNPDRITRLLERNPMVLLTDVLRRVKGLKRLKGPTVVIRIDPRFLRDEVRVAGDLGYVP